MTLRFETTADKETELTKNSSTFKSKLAMLSPIEILSLLEQIDGAILSAGTKNLYVQLMQQKIQVLRESIREEPTQGG